MASEVDPIIVEVGFKEDASIQDVITHLSTVKEKMEDVSKTEGSTGFLDQLGLSDAGRQEIVTTLSTMISGLGEVGGTLTTIPTHLMQSFSVLKNEITGIETLLNSVNGKQKSLVGDSTKGMQSIQHMMMSVAGMSAQSQNIQDFSKSFGGATKTALGWSASDMAKYAPSVVSMVLEPAVRKIMAENKHGIGFSGIVSSIMRDNNNVAFLRNLAKNEGIDEMSREQIQANYEMMLRGWTPYAMTTGSASKLLDWKARGLYQTKAQALRVEDRFTKDSQDYQKLIFSGYGKNPYVEQQAAEYIRSQGGNPTRSYTQRKQSGLQGLHKFLREGNNMDELFPLLKEAGIATVNNKGQYQIYSNIREQQLQYLRARALQEYSNALRSDAPYEGNPTDVLFAGKMTGRQGRRPSLYLGLNNALPEGVIPSLAGFDPKTMGGYGGKINTGVSVGKTPTLARYYIPQTTIDFNKGAAVVRSNFWQKDLSKGIDARPDDEQAAITDSLISRMFGMKGDRTLGFGHDEKTGAIRRTTKVVGADGKERTYELTPNMFTADFSKFIKYNEEAGRYEVDKTHPDYARAERILSGKELVDYGINPETGKAEKYRFLYSKDDGRAIFGKESIAQAIEQRYAERHLPSPFKYGNDREAGIFFEGDNTKTIKQINAMAKMASSGTPIEELMSESQAERLRNATGIYANFEMMYDILDQMEKDSGGKYTGKWTKAMGRRMDGLAFGDPTIFGRDFQGRFASGTDKFAMGAYDWRPMLLKGWEAGRKLNPRLYGYDTDVTGMSDEEKMKHRAIFAPTGGASKEDRAAIEAYINGETYRDPTTGKVLSEDDLRKQYFTNVVASDAGYLIDRSASKSGLAYRTLSVDNFWNGKEGLFTKKDYDEAVAEGRVKNGEVRLLPWQQEKYRREYAAAAMPGYSGFIEMKNEGDMLSGKSFIPESVLRGVNAPAEVFEKSERLYRRSLEELNTTAGRIKQFQGDANAMEAIAEDPSWVWNNHTAITHIEQTRRALEARRARNEVMLDDERDENGNPKTGRQGTIAVGTVGQLAEIFQAMTGMSNKDYGEFQSLLPSVMEGNNAVFSKGVSSSVIDMLTRFPFASGQYMMDVNNYAQATEVDDYLNSLDELSKTKSRLGRLRRRNNKNFSTQRADRIAELEKNEAELQQKVAGYQDRINNGADEGNQALKMAEALRKSGRDPRTITSMMMTAGQIYSMNTGDFDGDTVNAFIGMSEAFKHNARVELEKVRPEIQKQREAELRKVDLEAPEQSPLLSKGEGVMQAWAQASTATQKMAVASAALRKAQTGDPNDPSRVIALAEAMQAYDLATSDVKTKNADFRLGSYAEKYLYSQGAHYERFIKQLQDNSADGTSTGREGLFKFSAASTLDPEGIFALSARHSNARMEGKGGIFDLDSYEKMENWYRKEFGAENTEESRAARFYLDRMEDNIIWGKLWSRKDIDEGNKRVAAWGSKLDARRQAGQNVDEEYARYEDFRKRMAEMVDEKGIAGTEENVRHLAERYERMAQDETDQTKSKGYSLYAENLRKMLPENEDENERKAREAFIETKKHSDYTWAKEVRTLEEASRDQQNLDSIVQNTRIGNIVAAAKGKSGRSIYNWSNAKHFIGADQLDGKLYFDGIQRVDLTTGEKKNLPAQTVDYYRNADSLNRHMRDMILDASGEKDRTEAWRNPMTHIGQLMHSTFERIKTPSERAVYNTDQEAEAAGIQWMREALLGKTDRDTTGHDMAALRSLGLGFIETETGALKAINIGNKHRFSSDELSGYTNIANNLLGSGGSKGFMQQQLDVLREAEKQGEEVLSIEDKLYRGGQQVSNNFGKKFYHRIVTDKEGNVVTSETSLDKDFQYQLKEGEKEHVFETHAKPDYVTRMKDADANGVHGLHVYDWKSSATGALESLPQSMFYANMFAELGKKFHDTGDQRYEQFKEWYDPNTGRSTVKTITGVNPRQGGENYNFDATTDAGRKQIADFARKVDIGMLTEEKLGLAGFEQAWPYLSRIADKKEITDQEIKSARQMLDNNEFNASSAEMDFFLSTYGQNKERLSQLRSDVYREHNKNYMNPEEYVPQDRFTQRERELKEMFSQQMLAAVIANAGDSEAINKEVQDIQDTRAKLLAMNEQDAINAVSGDLDQSRTTIRQMLKGVKPSSESNVVFGAVGALRRAAQTKEYLKADEKYYDKTSGFKVNDDNQEVAEIAKKRKEAYEKAEEEEKAVNEYLTENLVDYTSRYDKQQTSKIKALTRTKPLDPTESFNNYVENKQNELQKLIDQYNENVRAYDEQINKTSDPRVKASLERLRDIDKGNAEQLQQFVDSGEITEQAIQERRRQLGIDKETPNEESDRWLQERLSVIKAERAKRFSNLMDLETSDQSTLAEKEEYQKTIEEQKKLEEQAASMKERGNRIREDQYKDTENTLMGRQLSPAEQAERRVNAFRDQITQRRDSLGINDPLRAQYDKLLNDKDAWTNMQARMQKEAEEAQLFRQDQQDLRYDQLMRQGKALNRNNIMGNRFIINRALSARDSKISSWENYQTNINGQIREKEKWLSDNKDKAGTEEYSKVTGQLKELQNASTKAGNAIQGLSGPMGTVSAVAGTFAESITRVATRLGRRLFMKAIAEAKKFVKEFDAAMTSIQMITLKSDGQMSTLGDGLIAKAKELKVSISDITKSAETLYRQGLSDEEVNERLDVISKFSKVSGTKVDAATKLITVAMNTGLVSDAQTAANVVTALGDNAATNATEIEKGIEKAGAAAAADGTTFTQLASMLTAITSTTQIGGNVAGRTLNTIFGRMNKIGTNELIYDENGHAVSGSAVAKLLQAQGVKTYDEQGNKRSSYDVLYDLSQKWDTISDAEQQQIATAIAGTRQYSNFAAIMQGMSEGKVDEYMNLAADSNGIVDKKYDAYLRSLQASLTDLKNTFDGLVNDLTKSGIAEKVIKGLTNIIKGVDNLVNSEGGLTKIIGLMISLAVAMAAIKSGNPIAMLAGAAFAGVTLAALGSSGAQEEKKSGYESWTDKNEKIDAKVSKRAERISELKTLKNKGSNRTEEEDRQYKGLIQSIFNENKLNSLDDASKSVDNLTSSAEALTKALQGTSEETDEYAQRLLDEEQEKHDKEYVRTVYSKLAGVGAAVKSKHEELVEDKLDYTTGRLPDSFSWIAQSEDSADAAKTLRDSAEVNIDSGGSGEDWRGLAKSFAAASKARIFTDEELNKLSEDDWYGRFTSLWNPTRNAALSDQNIKDFMEWQKEDIFPFQDESEKIYRDSLHDAFKQVYEDILGDAYTDEEINALANVSVDKYSESTFGGESRGIGSWDDQTVRNVQAFVEEMYGLPENGEFDKEVFDNAIEAAEIEGGYDKEKYARRKYLEQLGIRNGEEGDYYLDDHNNIWTIEEVSNEDKRIADLRQRQDSKYVSYGSDGQVVKTREGIEFASYEEAQQYLESEKKNPTKAWFFQDNEGNRYYTNEEGNPLTESEAKQLQADYEASGQANVQRSYYNPNTGETKVYEGKDVGEAADAFVEQWEEDVSKAFEIRQKGTSTQFEGTTTYGSAQEAADEVARLNAIEAEAYQTRFAEAQENWKSAIIDQYGEEAGSLIYGQLTGQNPEATIITNRQGNFVKSFATQTEADQFVQDNYQYYREGTGEYLGQGAKGYEAATRTRKKYYLDGTYLGEDEEGLEEYNRISEAGGAYRYTMSTGEIRYTTDEGTAKAGSSYARQKQEDTLQSAYEERLAELLYDTNTGYIESGGTYGNQRGVIDIDNGTQWPDKYVVEEYTDESGKVRYKASHLEGGAWSYQEGDMDQQGRISSLVEQTGSDVGYLNIPGYEYVSADKLHAYDSFDAYTVDTEYSRKSLQAYVDSIKEAIPSLEDVDPQIVLEVWGQLPKAIQENIRTTGEVGEEALKTVQEATNAALAAQPRYKAIKNHFMKGASGAYSSWETTNEYSVVSDKMLRMIQQNPEINDLQSLVKYVYENDIAQWSTLNTNGDFARLTAPIQLDHGIIQNSQEQQDEIYQAIIEWLYSKGRDYGALKLSSSKKAAYAQSAFDKMFHPNKNWEEQRAAAWQAEAERLGLDSRTTEYGRKQAEFYASYEATHAKPVYYDSEEAAYQAAEKKASADQKAWQEAYDKEYARTFYTKRELTQEELDNGWYHDTEGYIVDATGQRQYATGYENKETRKAVEDEFDQAYKKAHPVVNETKRRDEYLKGYEWITDTEKDYLKEVVGEDLYQRLWGTEGGATKQEKAYAMMLIENRRNGITELTEEQKAGLSSQVYADLIASNASKYAAMDDTTRAAHMAGVTGTSDLYQMALALEQSGTGITLGEAIAGKRTTGEEISDEELLNIFGGRYTAADLRAKNLSVSQANKLNSYRNNPNYQQISSTYAGVTNQLETERIKSYQQISSSQSKINRARTALDALDVSKSFEELDAAVVDELVSATGYTKDQIKTMWKAGSTTAKATLKASIDAQSSELTDALVATFDIMTEGIDYSSLGENADTETLASYFDETNAEVANYIRTVGIIVKNGKVTVQEGTEALFSTLQEMQDEEDASTATKKAARDLAYKVAFGTNVESDYRYYNKSLQERATAMITNNSQDLTSVDPALRYMLTLAAKPESGVTEADMQAAYNAAYYGAPTMTKYGYSARTLFGEGGFENRTWTAEELAGMRDRYKAEAPESPLVQLWDEMLSDMGDSGTAIKEYLNGTTENLPENFLATYTEWFNEESLKGLKDAVTISQNRTTLATGNAAERLALYSSFGKNQREILGAQFALNNPSDLESASAISSYLGMEEQDVRHALSTDVGKQSIQTAIEDKAKETYTLMAKSVSDGFEFDPSTGTLSELKTKLQEAADKATGDAKVFLQNLADSINDAGELIGQSNTSFTEEYNKTMSEIAGAGAKRDAFKWLRENIKTTAEEQMETDVLDAEGNATGERRQMTLAERIQAKSEAQGIKWNGVMSTQLGGALGMYESGNINQDQFNTILDYIENGTSSPGLTNSITQGLFAKKGLVGADGMFKIPETDEAAAEFVKSMQEIHDATDGTSEMLDVLFEKYPDLKAFFETGDKSKAAEALKNINAQMTSDKVAQATKFTKASKNVAEAMGLINKGGKEAAEGYAMLRKNSRDRVDKMTAAMVGAKDTKGNYKAGNKLTDQTRNVIASAFEGIDADDLKDYTAEQMEDLLADLPDYLNKQLVDDLNAGLQGLHIPVDLSGIAVDGNGYVDLSALEATLNAVDTDIYNTIVEMIKAQGGEWGSVKFNVNDDGQLVVVSAETSFNKKGKYSSGGAGKKSGGGGGKTATDKLLEQQKRRVAQVEHEGKILEIYGKGYDFLNDYDAQMSNIDNQIANQRKLRDVYEQNIAEMQAQLAVVERGSDDWFKLAEAINAARESMASIQNTINELNTQKIQILEQKLEYEKGPNTHKSNLLEKFAQRYQITDRHEAYVSAQKKMIKTTEDRIKINENAIKHWEDLLKKTVKESDAWYSIRDKIWGLQEENEELKTDIVNAKIELEQTKADQMAKDIQDSIAASQHESDILGIYLDAFQTTNQFDKYREALTTIGTNLQLKKAAQNSLINDLRKQADKKLKEIEKAESADKRDEENIAILKKQYEVYVKAIREAELEAAQTDVDVLTNRQAIEESYITEIQRKNEPREKALEHQSKMLELYMRKYQTDKNYYYQEELLSQTADLTSEKIDLQKEKLQSLLDLQNSGQITEGSQQWYDLQDAIYATTEAIVELESSMNDLAQLNFDHIVQMFKEGTTDLYSAVVGDKKFFGNNNAEIQEQISSYIAEKQGEYSNTETIFAGLKADKKADIKAIKDEYNPQIKEAKAAYDAAVEKTKPYEEAKAALDKFDADKQAALDKAEADYKAQIKDINADKSLKKAQKDKKKAAAKKKWEAEKKKINKKYSSAKRKPLKTEVDKYADLEAFLPDKDTTKAKYNDLVSERDYLLGLENERLETIKDNEQTALSGIQEALSVFADYLELERDENGNIKTDENGNIDYAHSNIDADAISNVVSALIESSLVGTDQLQHERNLIGYQQTKYQNRGELTNVGRMMEYDREVMDEMYAETELQIEAWKEYAETVKDNPEMFAKATGKIREQEEVLAKLTVEIEKNTDAQEKNTEAIRQARIKAENELDKAIRAIIQKQRNMLAATVQIQNAILDTIRNSYREQWDLEKKTIDKKKQALAEEKNLISERLNFRKKMMDQESKDEELAEYKRQLALISADTTRTKEANELRRKIAEMEKDKALQDAQDIASAEISSLDDQSKAWDIYASNKEEDLNTFLSDANNFIDTLDELMSGSFENFVAWNAKYNTSYKKSTAEQREQMEQGWDDTWLNMLGRLRTYWDEVDESLRSKDAFMSIVTSQDDYIKRSDTDKESFRWNMSEIYDAFTNSLIDNAEFSDTHEIINKIDDLKDWTFDVKISNPEDYILDPNYSNYIYERSRAKLKNYDIKFNEYKGWGIDAPPPQPLPEPVNTDVPSTGGGGGGNGGPSGPTTETPKRWAYKYTYDGKHRSERTTATTYDAAYAAGKKEISDVAKAARDSLAKQYPNGGTDYEYENKRIGELERAALQTLVAYQYKHGGLVDYTGPAWVDGTKTRPEAFLNADDTALLRSMLDEFTYVKNAPYMTRINESSYGQKGINIGDVNVNLYEAKLEKDEDYDAIAQKVGKAFTKELQKNGFNLAGYAW